MKNDNYSNENYNKFKYNEYDGEDDISHEYNIDDENNNTDRDSVKSEIKSLVELKQEIVKKMKEIEELSNNNYNILNIRK